MTTDLESRITEAQHELICATNPNERRVKWRKMRALIMRRTPERCREMEIALFGRVIA